MNFLRRATRGFRGRVSLLTALVVGCYLTLAIYGRPNAVGQDANGAEPSTEASAGADSSNDKTVYVETDQVVIDGLKWLEGLRNTPMAIGQADDRVRELQATLNKRLVAMQEFSEKETGKSGIELVRDVRVGDAKGIRAGDKNKVRMVYLPDRGKSFSIRGDWYPLDGDGEKLEFSDPNALLPAERIKLPDEVDPLKVDGIFGQHTFAAVMLFQLEENLPITGNVDPVTIDKLEPMIPTNPFLAAIMSRVGAVLDKDFDYYAWWVKTITAALMSLLIFVASFGVYQAAKTLSNSTQFLSRWLFTPESSPWFTALRRNKVFLRMAQFAPAMSIYFGALAVFPRPLPRPDGDTAADPFPYLDVFQDWHLYVSRLGLAYASLVLMIVAQAVVNAFDDIYSPNQDAENPISGLVRAAKRFVGLAGAILILAAFAGRNPIYVVGGLGAFMAVIMLVFRDYLLGLVASVQIIANRIVSVGDWIEMPKYAADGDVQEISLNLVKVQNFDKTISTIPTYSLLTESFRNWSGMREAGGRRIKRSLFIDMHSIKVCTAEMIARFEKMELIQDYIDRKRGELEEYNRDHDAEASPVNSRRLTNIGTFRAYLEAYLANHPKLSGEMTQLVRHLQPTDEGLPIEIYAYCTDTAWVVYEAVQADVFDHILAILPEFELRAFQAINDLDVVMASDSAFDELKGYVESQNRYLEDRKTASVNAARKRIQAKIQALGLEDTHDVKANDRVLSIVIR